MLNNQRLVADISVIKHNCDKYLQWAGCLYNLKRGKSKSTGLTYKIVPY